MQAASQAEPRTLELFTRVDFRYEQPLLKNNDLVVVVAEEDKGMLSTIPASVGSWAQKMALTVIKPR